ncbi:MAG TPA: YchJ family metal-binding protein [Methyloradius sp.]|nr:YchJ family metal-binding protein [Methyloradius sp.]
MKNKPISDCICESGKSYTTCCEPLHKGQLAPTAETLMRSRYSAYVLNLEDYLLATWHPDTRPARLDLSKDEATKWLGLQIKHTSNTDADNATVEFVARYKLHGKAERLHEISRFIRIESHWLYLDGSFPEN